uniref:BZIP domain-containing protein n=1 Tax=Mycena chlorophos TaxID=658473 RepID=A0ABQ0LQX5_MYCCL|nr:predicted protein [Mycena chlorophos]
MAPRVAPRPAPTRVVPQRNAAAKAPPKPPPPPPPKPAAPPPKGGEPIWSTGKQNQHRFRVMVPVDHNQDQQLPPPLPEPAPNTFLVFEQAPFQKSKYREKFNMMRDRFDRLTKRQQEQQEQLDLAMSKIKRLEEENNMLLDAIGVAAARDPAAFVLSPPGPQSPETRPADLGASFPPAADLPPLGYPAVDANGVPVASFPPVGFPPPDISRDEFWPGPNDAP